MASVYEKNVECPVCGAKTAFTYLNCNTNEREWSCRRCGFFSETKIIEHQGLSFWQVRQEMPMSKDGKVAWPMEATSEETVEAKTDRTHDGHRMLPPKWNQDEFGVMPCNCGDDEGCDFCDPEGMETLRKAGGVIEEAQ